MIDDDLTMSSEDGNISPEDLNEISKSQRKRDADSIRNLGATLAELAPSELASIELPDDVLSAIRELNNLRAHGARKRQLGYLAKRLRQIDAAPIETALRQLRLAARANTKNLHVIEHWRDRLLGDSGEESPKEALTAFLHEYKEADRQQIRHLQRRALAERQSQRPPAAARQLFKVVRAQILPQPGSD